MASSSFDGIDDEEAFRSALGTLIASAHRNGIHLERGWVCRPDGVAPAWEVDVVRLAADGGASRTG